MKKEKKVKLILSFEEFEVIRIILENSVIVNKKHILENNLGSFYNPLLERFGLNNLLFNIKENEKT